MISDFLIAELEVRIPERSFVKSTSPDAIATFPAAHPNVGNLAIYDDGDEARVEITRLTHGHFGCWEESLSKTEREKDIADSVVDFVEQIFANKVIFFSLIGGRGGGWQTLKPDGTLPGRSPLKIYFTWSGPLSHK